MSTFSISIMHLNNAIKLDIFIEYYLIDFNNVYLFKTWMINVKMCECENYNIINIMK